MLKDVGHAGEAAGCPVQGDRPGAVTHRHRQTARCTAEKGHGAGRGGGRIGAVRVAGFGGFHLEGVVAVCRHREAGVGVGAGVGLAPGAPVKALLQEVGHAGDVAAGPVQGNRTGAATRRHNQAARGAAGQGHGADRGTGGVGAVSIIGQGGFHLEGVVAVCRHREAGEVFGAGEDLAPGASVEALLKDVGHAGDAAACPVQGDRTGAVTRRHHQAARGAAGKGHGAGRGGG